MCAGFCCRPISEMRRNVTRPSFRVIDQMPNSHGRRGQGLRAPSRSARDEPHGSVRYLNTPYPARPWASSTTCSTGMSCRFGHLV